MPGPAGETKHQASLPAAPASPPAPRLADERSQQIAERARRVLWKGGKEATQHEALRACGLPRFLARAAGCTVWDADGNAYIDYLMSWGTVLLGHGDAGVEAEVARQQERGSNLNLAIEQEVSLAERLVRHIPGAELVRFLATGAEATAAAVRIARAATGREQVIQYGFHGWLDWSSAAHPVGVPPETLSDVLTLKYNDPDALEEQLRAQGDGVACIIMEPIKDQLPQAGFLGAVVELAHRHGALVVFDEAKTGFRFGLGGAAAHFGVIPDLAIFSKALANGYPLSAVVGKREVFERASEAWISGTYHGWPPAIAAAHATLTALEKQPVVSHVWTLGERLIDGFNSIMARHGLAVRLTPIPSMPQLVHPPEETATVRRIVAALVARGHFVHPIRPWFISYAHDAQSIERTLTDAELAAAEGAAP